MAARETGFGAVEAYMHQGKLLALDLVVRLLENPLQVSLSLRRTLDRRKARWRVGRSFLGWRWTYWCA